MSERETLVIERVRTREVAIQGAGVRLTTEPELGIAKLQILSDDPDAWLAGMLGVAAPAPLREVEAESVRVAWLAPGEWLVTGLEDAVEAIRQRCAQAAGSSGLMVSLTDGRASFTLNGAAARRVIATHCPLDLSDAEMPVGAAMRSLFSETGFFLSRLADRENQPCFRLIFDQTMAGYAERMFGLSIHGQG